MTTMKRVMSILLFGPLLLATGCDIPWRRGPEAEPQQKVEPSGESVQLRRLRTENEALRSEKAEILLKMEELQQRQSALDARCRHAERMAEGYKAQVRAVVPAIQERDAALAENDRLKAELVTLRQQVDELRRLLSRVDGGPQEAEPGKSKPPGDAAQTKSSSSGAVRHD